MRNIAILGPKIMGLKNIPKNGGNVGFHGGMILQVRVFFGICIVKYQYTNTWGYLDVPGS